MNFDEQCYNSLCRYQSLQPIELGVCSKHYYNDNKFNILQHAIVNSFILLIVDTEQEQKYIKIDKTLQYETIQLDIQQKIKSVIQLVDYCILILENNEIKKLTIENQAFKVEDIQNQSFQQLKDLKYICSYPVQIQNNDFQSLCIGLNEQNQIVQYNLINNIIQLGEKIDIDDNMTIQHIYYNNQINVLAQEENQSYIISSNNREQLDISSIFLKQLDNFLLFYNKDNGQIESFEINSKIKQQINNDINSELQSIPVVLYNRRYKLINILFNSEKSGFDAMTYKENNNQLVKLEEMTQKIQNMEKNQLQDNIYPDYYKSIDFCSSSFRKPFIQSRVIDTASIEIDGQKIPTEEGLDNKEYYKEVQNQDSELYQYCYKGQKYYQLLYGFNAIGDEDEIQLELNVILATNKYEIRKDLANDEMYTYTGNNVYDMADFGPFTDELMKYDSKNAEQLQKEQIEEQEKIQEQQQIEKLQRLEKLQKQKLQQIATTLQTYEINRNLYNQVNQEQKKLNQEQQFQQLLKQINKMEPTQIINLLMTNQDIKNYLNKNNQLEIIEEIKKQLQVQKQQQKKSNKVQLQFGERQVIGVDIQQL